MGRLAEYIEPMLRALLDRVATAVPGQCQVCRAFPAQPVCEACIARFAQPVARCRRCALPVPAGITECGQCLRAPPPLDACHAAVSYAYPWSVLIGHFKFQGQPAWAGSFATLLRSAPWVEPAIEAADLLLPMPLSRQKLAARGFNQALELARHLAPAKTRETLLLRLRDTAPQLALDREARMANVRNAFALDPLRAGSVRGRHLLLVDDVMTSGATLFSAAHVLRRAGAAGVSAVVIARTD